MKKCFSAVVFFVLLFLAAAPAMAGAPEGQWAMKGDDAFGSHRNPNAVLRTGKILWSVDVPRYGVSSLIIDKEGTVYVFSDYGIAIKPDGAIKWSTKESEDVFSFDSTGVIADDGFIYILSQSGELYRFSTGDGSYELLAEVDTFGGIFGWAHFIMDNTARIFAVSSPFTFGGAVYLHSLLTSGEVRFQKQVGSASFSDYSPVMHTSGKLLLYGVGGEEMDTQGVVLAADPETGAYETIYTPEAKPLLYDAPSVDPDTGWVFVPGSMQAEGWGFVAALNENFEVMWERNDFPSRIQAAVGPELIYLVGYEDEFAALDKLTGEIKWRYEITHGVDSNKASAVVDGCGNAVVVYGGSDGETFGNVIAVAPDGTELFRFEKLEGGQPLGTPALADDGTLYVRAGGKVYAIGGDPIECDIPIVSDDDDDDNDVVTDDDDTIPDDDDDDVLTDDDDMTPDDDDDKITDDDDKSNNDDEAESELDSSRSAAEDTESKKEEGCSCRVR
ncbi:MAG: hypothetical protein Kow0090_12610 [Myxococcota bacterium]